MKFPFSIFCFILCIVLSCENNPEKTKFIPVGATVTLKPVSIDGAFLNPPSKNDTAQALQLSFMWGSRPLNLEESDYKVLFYGINSKIAEISFMWSYLQEAFKKTNCPAELVKHSSVTGPGYAMLCDGKLDPSKVSRIELVNDHGDVRYATSWSYFQSEPTVNTLAASFFE